MKKLLSLLFITNAISLVTINEIACSNSSNNGGGEVKPPQEIIDIINKINMQSVIIRGGNILSNTTHEDTKNLILNTIGLTAEQQTLVKADGVLIADAESTINFTVTKDNFTEKTTQVIIWLTSHQDTAISKEITTSELIINDNLFVGTKNGLYKGKVEEPNLVPIELDVNTVSPILQITKTTNSIYVCTSNGLYISNLDGINFKKATVNSLIVKSFYSIYEQNNIIYTGTDSGIFKSDATGDNFETLATTGLPTYALRITDIFYDDDGTIYIGTDFGLYKKISGGTRFTNVILSSKRIERIFTIYKTSDGTIYVGTLYRGLYKSIDHTNFTLVSGLINPYSVFSVFESLTKHLYVGTSYGLFELKNDQFFLIGYKGKQIGTIIEYNSTIYLTNKYYTVSQNHWKGLDYCHIF